jgi:hypothetical protein
VLWWCGALVAWGVPRAWECGCTGCILLDAACRSMLRAGGLARAGRHGCDMTTARAATTRRGTAYAAWAREWRGKVGMEQRLRCLRWVHSDTAAQRHSRRHREWTGRLQQRTRAAVSHSRVSQSCCSMRAWLAGGQQRRCSEPRAGGRRDAEMQQGGDPPVGDCSSCWPALGRLGQRHTARRWLRRALPMAP